LPSKTHDFHCSGNDCYYPGTTTSDAITDDNIFREMNRAGISWKVYAQSYVLAGGTPTTPDQSNGTSYYRRHNGAVWYSDILNNVDGSANNVVDFSQFAIDMANGALPRFSIIVPDGDHDAHDCPVGMSSCTEQQKLVAADGFLNSTLTPVLGTADFQAGGDGLIFVTFDECGGGTDEGCGSAVYTAAIGPKVVPNTVSKTPYKHENTLRTMLDALGIKTLPGAASIASDMSDFFASKGKRPAVVLGQPANGATPSSPVEIEAWAFATASHAISEWEVYVDGAGAYNAGTTGTIHPSLTMSNGPHKLRFRARDTSGALQDQTRSLTVQALKPAVTISTPANLAGIGAPVNLIATASPTPGHTISGWYVYIDDAAAYNTGAANSINTNIPLSIGTHVLNARAWDTSGAFGDQTLTLNVTGNPAVAVSTPLTGANVLSPIHVVASATASGGQSISGWYVYVDGKAAYNTGPTSSINTTIPVPSGTHAVLVRAWDTSGAYGDQTLALHAGKVAVNVGTPAQGAVVNSPVNIQATASSIHAISEWDIYVDSVPSSTQGGGNSINTSVAMSSGSHKVMVRASNSAGASGEQTFNVTVP
jgi:hypothetical protein